jgi:hypothetical protein
MLAAPTCRRDLALGKIAPKGCAAKLTSFSAWKD